MHFLISRDERETVVIPADKLVTDALTFSVKVKEEVVMKLPHGRTRTVTKFVRRNEQMYEIGVVADNREGVITRPGFWELVRDTIRAAGHTFEILDHRQPFPAPDINAAMKLLLPAQKPWLMGALMADESGLAGAPTRFGKCLAPDTPVMMVDGSVKPARNIMPGDQLMGPDSKPRTVLNCIAGRDTMFRITPNKGDAFECTGDHYLVLQRTQDGTVMAGDQIAITVDDYLTRSRTFKHIHKLVHAAVNFPKKPTTVDPYCFGMWLGDGHTGNPGLTSDDPVLITAWEAEAARCGLRTVHNDRHRRDTTKTVIMRQLHGTDTKGITRTARSNVWMDQVKRATPNGVKRIPREFLINSREIRLQVLAGIIDTDGWLENKKAYCVTWKYRETAQDLVALCRGLGFRCTIREKERSAHPTHLAIYHHVTITGNLNDIPVRLPRKKAAGLKHRCNPLTTGFSVERVGEGDYYGFELDGDRKFLLGSFLVTHNSYGIAAYCAAFRKLKTVITAPGTDLCRQLYDLMVELFPGRAIFGAFDGGGYYVPEIGKVDPGGCSLKKGQKVPRSRSGMMEVFTDSITVCSMDSLHKQDHYNTRLLLIDEPHAIVTATRAETIAAFVNARKIAFGATLHGRHDKRDAMIVGLVGPIISLVSYKEAVDMGSIAPLKVLMIKVPFSRDTVPGGRFVDRQVVYNRLLFKSSRMAELIRRITHDIIPLDWQTMAFIADEKQAEFYMKYAMPHVGTIAMAKRMKNNDERETMMRSIANGDVQRVLASKIYVQGLTFPDLKVVINLVGGGANTTAIQKPGRLLQKRPGKNYGVLIDFMFECRDDNGDGESKPWYCMIRESWDRHRLYCETGYDVQIVSSAEEVKAVIDNAFS